MKILLTITLTLTLLTAISLLLDLQFIADNWLRYALVILLAIIVLSIGAKIAWIQLKELNDKIND